MQKTFLLFLFISIAKINFAQVPITDTIGYLRDSIQAKRTYYIGKPLSVLLNDLKLNIVSYTARVPFNTEPEIIQFKVTSLQFYSSGVLLTRSYDKIKTPNIFIEFDQSIPIPRKKFEIGNILDWTTGWTPEKAAFFGDHILSDLQIWGL